VSLQIIGIHLSRTLIDKSATDPETQFLRVSTKGQFLHDREMLVGPRTRTDQHQQQSGGLFGSGSRVGYFVFTPFKIQESGEIILVNRGWIPREFRDSQTRKQNQVGINLY
jgi:surfeit locus 1 family protein